MKLENKAALITGASRGLGRALAAELARRGAKVVLAARGKHELEDAVHTIRARGGEAHGLVADLASPDAAVKLAGEAAAVAGPIEVVVHNASELGPVPLELLLDTKRADFERTFAVNVFGPFALSKAIAGAMVLRGSGAIVHISSDASVSAYARWGAYGASKAALDQLSRIWAAELEKTGVRVFAVDPGEMDTKMHADAVPDANRAELRRPEDVAKKIADLIEHDESAPNGARLVA